MCFPTNRHRLHQWGRKTEGGADVDVSHRRIQTGCSQHSCKYHCMSQQTSAPLPAAPVRSDCHTVDVLCPSYVPSTMCYDSHSSNAWYTGVMLWKSEGFGLSAAVNAGFVLFVMRYNSSCFRFCCWIVKRNHRLPVSQFAGLSRQIPNPSLSSITKERVVWRETQAGSTEASQRKCYCGGQ